MDEWQKSFCVSLQYYAVRKLLPTNAWRNVIFYTDFIAAYKRKTVESNC